MTIFSATDLLISLPAAEIAGLDLPGSLMTAEQAFNLPISHTLISALALIESHCHTRCVATRYLARPEIFTHGVAAAWLRKRLGDFGQHLCITDASTVKHIEGCRTHMFLYRLAYHDSYASFFRLTRRAPELMAQVFSQVNTSFSWSMEGRRKQPQQIYLEALSPPPSPPAVLYPFQFTPYLAEQTAERILQKKPSPSIENTYAKNTIYIPLTETGLQDAAFVGSVARYLREAYLKRETQLFLRLPNERFGDTLVMRIAFVLESLAATGMVLPRSAPSNIFFISADLTAETAPPNMSIVLHESFDFWRHPRSFYDMALSISIEASALNLPDPEFLPLDVTPIFGNRATRVWLEPPRSRLAT